MLFYQIPFIIIKHLILPQLKFIEIICLKNTCRHFHKLLNKEIHSNAKKYVKKYETENKPRFNNINCVFSFNYLNNSICKNFDNIVKASLTKVEFMVLMQQKSFNNLKSLKLYNCYEFGEDYSEFFVDNLLNLKITKLTYLTNDNYPDKHLGYDCYEKKLLKTDLQKFLIEKSYIKKLKHNGPVYLYHYLEKVICGQLYYTEISPKKIIITDDLETYSGMALNHLIIKSRYFGTDLFINKLSYHLDYKKITFIEFDIDKNILECPSNDVKKIIFIRCNFLEEIMKVKNAEIIKINCY